ncbi:TolC family protein [Defluviitalea phaphyphila]|uniref:TolC family protein n=1 Tax=Defluviitalea phaphyphila TaxID=1473580 RepID=UPI000730CC1F|nr:TolC family protein [Defluviitalea phaphyphila]
MIELKSKKIWISWTLVLILVIVNIFPSLVIAKEIESDVEEESEEESKVLSLDEAIEKGLENSFLLEQVKKEVELAKLIDKNATSSKQDLYDAKYDLLSASYELDDGRIEAYDSLAQLDSAEAALSNGIAPQDIPLPNGYTIPKGTNIRSFLNEVGLGDMVESIIASVQEQLDENRVALDEGLEALEAANKEYLSAKSEYDATITFAMTTVARKLGTSTISSLDATALADLLKEMASISNEVTAYSYNIYKNQVALLIQNSYYEALKQQKLLEAKDKARERGLLQYELAKAAYEVGAKSKDDMLLAKSYYEGTEIAYELQKKDYINAMTELKKNLNIPLDEEIILVEKEAEEIEDFDLDKGIQSGLRARLEIKKAKAQVAIYKELKKAVDKTYDHNDNQYKEAELLIEKAEIEYNKTKLDVEAEIRQSYTTLKAMEKSLEASKELLDNAKENLEIAKAKYEAGYGISNALLQNLNIESMSGTMVEVIAAEENLASMEERVIEITNGYNLARLKYLNDIGILPY